MTTAEREGFLAAPHVGVLAVSGNGTEPGRGVLAVPIWYAYQPGGLITVITGRDSAKARLIRAVGRFALCAQQEEAPCRYVSVEGPVVEVEGKVDPAERAAMAHRYMQPEVADAYLAVTMEQLAKDITIRMRPERWNSADFAAVAALFTEPVVGQGQAIGSATQVQL
ncbi:pyridoxamine 5'-phosphate oxidase family protein [Kitasatospora purpeofusca]|uniref:pyridoxamine 5'-phosphate oxidase family protein n=1 Tax=Kitasatospora purpeofusca TaxID=67352 RepID=UPI002A5A2781|nr:pyridoxamine 5'-phosphate oxidase family protein [Kitasatospora purpeofusca]MDY0811465.1 pyridoxamine 5'-phosphate oxidase family protein [Kitasatospora purpeofusca]